MMLTPRESEKLLIYVAADLARKTARPGIKAERAGIGCPHHRVDPGGARGTAEPSPR